MGKDVDRYAVADAQSEMVEGQYLLSELMYYTWKTCCRIILIQAQVEKAFK